MKVFPCIHIAMDAQGGGIAIMEALHDKDKIQEGEMAIWPVIDENKFKDTDGNPGLHILEMCQFAKADWLAEANHGMRKDFEDKSLLFPFYDGVSLGLSVIEDENNNRIYDTLEDCILDIEELKNELSMIQVKQTGAGRERWDTPEVVIAAGKKSKMRKDRYSALLIANMAARTMQRLPPAIDYRTIGGFAGGEKSDDEGPMYMGPSWWTEQMKDVY